MRWGESWASLYRHNKDSFPVGNLQDNETENEMENLKKEDKKEGEKKSVLE